MFGSFFSVLLCGNTEGKMILTYSCFVIVTVNTGSDTLYDQLYNQNVMCLGYQWNEGKNEHVTYTVVLWYGEVSRLFLLLVVWQ